MTDLLSEEIDTLKAVKEQDEIINKLKELRNFILLKEADTTNKINKSIKKAKNKTQRKQFFAAQRSVLRNAIKLYDKRVIIIHAFINKDVEKDVDYEPEKFEPEFEESIAEKIKMRTQKSGEKNQEKKGLEILTPNQMLTRLPVTLA